MPYALPERVWPLRLARSGERLEGAVSGALLPRLRDAVSGINGDVVVSLGFQHEGRVCTVRGRVQVSVERCCQRCLQPMDWQSQIEVAARFAKALEKVQDMASDLEYVRLQEDESASLSELVEDEILLAMPQIARHGEHECTVHPQPEVPADEAPRENPFAVLAALKSSD